MQEIPADVRRLVREILSDVNNQITAAISKQPGIYEQTLDHMLVNAMNCVPLTISPESGAALAIDTHWIGGRRFYKGRREIADIALVAILRREGHLVWRKVALLQSKRLYSREIRVAHLEEYDYRVGIGRLIDQPTPQVPLYNQRAFSFTSESKYEALLPGDRQVENIDRYSQERSMPVYYSFYNPLTIPFESIVPQVHGMCLHHKNEIGCRVIRSTEVHKILLKLTRRIPTFNEINGIDEKQHRGWRIEHFVADEFLQCSEGRRINGAEHPDLHSLLYERSVPFNTAIVFKIDLPSNEG